MTATTWRRSRPPREAPSIRPYVDAVGALTSRRIHHMRAAPGRVVGVVINPLVMLLVIGFVFRDALRLPVGVPDNLLFVVPGIALQVGLASIGPSAISLRGDLDSGLTQRLRSLPVRRSAALCAHLLADTLLGAGVLTVVLMVAAALGWRPAVSAAAFVVGFAICCLFVMLCGAVGMFLGVVVRAPESIDALAALVLVICSFASSLLIAPELTPDWFRRICEYNPISALASVLRDLWGGSPVAGGGAEPVTVLASCAVMLALSVLALTPMARRRRRSPL